MTPSDKARLLELAERCEVASGPDRELDCEIVVALHGGEIVWKTANYTMETYPAHRLPSRNHVGGFANEPVSEFTASLDIAMTLVPEGWAWRIDWRPLGLDLPPSGPPGYAFIYHDLGKGTTEGYATTPALALCAASLKALASLEREDGE